MSLKVYVDYNSDIDELLKRYNCFEFLKKSFIPKLNNNKWYMNFYYDHYITDNYFNLNEKIIYALQVIFIGKTGYGKSTTLNKIVGNYVFKSDNISVCTKDLHSAIYSIDRDYFLLLSDLPGIGESNYADKKYYEWYRNMVKKSSCIVYILRADQRDFVLDEILFKSILSSIEDRKKVIFALNYADKIEPINRNRELSQKQLLNLQKKVEDVSKIFNTSYDNILYYSAVDNFNLDILTQKISNKLKLFIK